MTYIEWLEANRDYVLLDSEGDILARVSLENMDDLAARESFMATLTLANGSKWSEASEYNFEG